MESSVLSDEEYDLVSDPGSSIADLGSQTIFEPEPAQAAKDRFQTVRFTAQDIQDFISNSLPPSVRWNFSKVVRIYADGAFDSLTVAHVLHLRQAKLSFPRAVLVVGVFSDVECVRHNDPATYPHLERCELVRHCRWVDEVITEAPWKLSMEFCKTHRIDYVAVPEGSSVDPSCDRTRLKGYDELRASGKVIPTRRTMGLFQPKITRQSSVASNLTTLAGLSLSDPAEPSSEDEGKMPGDAYGQNDQFGIGI